MKNSSVTICKIVGFGHSSGRASSEVAIYEYRVNGKLYKSDSPFPSDKSIKIGDCYNLKYSIDDPQVTDVLFEDGKVGFEGEI
nr:hypothetical protein [uncultured Bacteroides sp.]